MCVYKDDERDIFICGSASVSCNVYIRTYIDSMYPSTLVWFDLIWPDLIWFDLIWCIYIYTYIHIFWSYRILPDLILSVYPYGYRFEPLEYRWVPEDKMRVCMYIYMCVYTHALLGSNHHNDRCHEGEYQQYWARVFDQNEKNMGQLGPRSS